MQRQKLTAVRIGLVAAILVPVVYYGAQAMAIPFYPGYNILTENTNLLGSEFADHPLIMNGGLFLAGIAAFAAAFGIHVALRALGARLILTWLTTLTLLSLAFQTLWVSFTHMPHPRALPLVVGATMLLLPVLMPVTFLWVRNAVGIKFYLFLNLLANAVMILFLGNLLYYDRMRYFGLLEHCFLLTLYAPVGVVGAFLLRRLNRQLAA